VTERLVGAQPMSSSQKAKAKKRLNEAEKRDKRIEKLKQLQNDYETLIYSSRDFLEEEENSAYFKSEDDKEKLKLFLNEAEAWLYGAGSDSEFDIMKGKLRVLEKKISPIKKRKNTRQQVPEEIENLKAKLDENLASFNKHARKNNWLPKDELDEYKQLVIETRDYLDTKLVEIQEIPLHRKLPFTIGDVQKEVKKVTDKLKVIKRIKKPREEVESHGELSDLLKDEVISSDGSSQTEQASTEGIQSKDATADVTDQMKMNMMNNPSMKAQIEMIRKRDQLKNDLIEGKYNVEDLTDAQKEELDLY
jgi:hypothetical protein